MAKIKMGAIVTEIAGSVGGTTFRRSSSGPVMYNKPSSIKKNKIMMNPALPKLRNIMALWYELPPVTQELWNAFAPTVPFYDKFGVKFFLTGRMLFFTLNTRLLMVGAYNESPKGFTQDVASLSYIGSRFETGRGLVVTYSAPIILTYVAIRGVAFQKGGHEPANTRRAYLGSINFNPKDFYDITFEQLEAMPYYRPGNYIRLFLYAMNQWGIRSSPQIENILIP